ncbi:MULTISPECIES: hypothetical protein [unclassified Bradyrhizobium]|uniref:hypothetical protein n=1 Tax=unclassified Bradyrhizobium TaxID=2631580 RepID=UPI0029168FFD|nr:MULTISPECIES: hypothetical protein [unclassified Bradyrhizobium]
MLGPLSFDKAMELGSRWTGGSSWMASKVAALLRPALGLPQIAGAGSVMLASTLSSCAPTDLPITLGITALEILGRRTALGARHRPPTSVHVLDLPTLWPCARRSPALPGAGIDGGRSGRHFCGRGVCPVCFVDLLFGAGGAFDSVVAKISPYGDYFEVMSIASQSIRLDRLKSGAAPLMVELMRAGARTARRI